jgi:PhnB protein
MNAKPELIPLLVVRDAARAVDFYTRALGARELVRYTNNLQGTISHADLALGGSVFSITEEARGWNSDAPPSLGGSPVVLQLKTDDVEAAFARLCAAGASVVFPLQDFCGERMARLRDPFGHLWILTQQIEELSVEEIQQRRDELFARFAAAAPAPEDPSRLPGGGSGGKP